MFERNLQDRLLAALILTLPLSLFGEFLVRRTHHRPLGAATFSSVAVALFLLGWMLAARRPSESTSASADQSRLGRRWAWAAWALGGIGFLGAIGRLIG